MAKTHRPKRAGTAFCVELPTFGVANAVANMQSKDDQFILSNLGFVSREGSYSGGCSVFFRVI
jgi:hypothetical protein